MALEERDELNYVSMTSWCRHSDFFILLIRNLREADEDDPRMHRSGGMTKWASMNIVDCWRGLRRLDAGSRCPHHAQSGERWDRSRHLVGSGRLLASHQQRAKRPGWPRGPLQNCISPRGDLTSPRNTNIMNCCFIQRSRRVPRYLDVQKAREYTAQMPEERRTRHKQMNENELEPVEILRGHNDPHDLAEIDSLTK